MARNIFKTTNLTRKKGQSGFVDTGILNVDVDIDKDAVQRVFAGPFTVVGRASAKAVTEVREAALERGRANIRAAGFPEQWVDALQSRQYPKRGKPGKKGATAFINYKFTICSFFF